MEDAGTREKTKNTINRCTQKITKQVRIRTNKTNREEYTMKIRMKQ